MIVNLLSARDIGALAPELGAEQASEIWYGGGAHTSRAGVEILCRPWAGWWRCLARGTRPTLAALAGGDPEALRAVEGLPSWATLRAEVYAARRPASVPSREALLAPWRACAGAVGARAAILRAGGGAELLLRPPGAGQVKMTAIERLPGGASLAPLRASEPDPAPCALASQLLAREARGDWVLFLPRD